MQALSSGQQRLGQCQATALLWCDIAYRIIEVTAVKDDVLVREGDVSALPMNYVTR